MISIQSELDALFSLAIKVEYGTDVSAVVVPTSDRKFGQYQCNAALALAGKLKRKPRDVAEAIVKAVSHKQFESDSSDDAYSAVDPSVRALAMIDRLEIAGPGFINIFLSPTAVAKRLATIVGDERLGLEPTTAPQTIIVDYSGPNVAKEMHVGHLRSTIIGDAIAHVFDFVGHTVIRQNHLGDWGTQFGMLIAFLQQQSSDSSDNTDITSIAIADLEGFYRAAKTRFDADPEFQTLARKKVIELQAGEPTAFALWEAIKEQTRRHYQPLYERLNVGLTTLDERGESFYNPFLRGVVDRLVERKIARESEGAVAVFIDGDDKPPLIIEKTGGGFLYGTTDLAAIEYRVKTLQADRIIYFTDNRQGQHFSQVFRTAKQAGWAGSALLIHAPFGSVLGPDNKPFKTRSGENVKLKDLLDEAVERALKIVEEKNPSLPDEDKQSIARAIGIGAVKYGDLSKDRSSDYVFNWDIMLAMEGNTGPYLQYAYARIRSIFRKAQTSADTTSAGQPSNAGSNALLLNSPEEFDLAVTILQFAEAVTAVTRDLRPHVLCQYLHDLAGTFSTFYEKCPVLKSDEPVRGSRITLCALTANTLALGLDLLGIDHPEQM